MLIFNF